MDVEAWTGIMEQEAGTSVSRAGGMNRNGDWVGGILYDGGRVEMRELGEESMTTTCAKITGMQLQRAPRSPALLPQLATLLQLAPLARDRQR